MGAGDRLCECALDQSNHRIGRVEHVRGGEADDAVAGVDQAIVPAVIGGVAVAVRGAGVLDRHGLCDRGNGGAGDRPRTGYLNLGKVALYQVSYARTESRF